MGSDKASGRQQPGLPPREIANADGPGETAKDADFAGCVQSLIAREDLADYLDENDPLAADLSDWAARLASQAFDERDDGALYQALKALYFLYEDNLKPPDRGAGLNQFSPFLLSIRGKLERSWERFELERIRLDAAEVPADPEDFRSYFKQICETHPMVGHRLFEFLEAEATRGDLINFFLSDAAVIVRFCDLVVLSMVGSGDEIRPELAENFWDEMGRGRFQERHAHLFRSLLEYVGVNLPNESLLADDFVDNLDWQGLAGYNLYLFLCLHRRNYLRALGCLGAAEMMDPEQYTKVLNGCRRVGLTDDDRLAYYSGHEEMDVAHGENWLQNVLLPLVKKYPDKRHEMVIGALMRINVTQDYYDGLYRKLSGNCC